MNALSIILTNRGTGSGYTLLHHRYNEKRGGAIVPSREDTKHTRETQGKGAPMDNEDDPHEEDLLAVDNRSKLSAPRLGVKHRERNQANVAHRFHKKRGEFWILG